MTFVVVVAWSTTGGCVPGTNARLFEAIPIWVTQLWVPPPVAGGVAVNTTVRMPLFWRLPVAFCDLRSIWPFWNVAFPPPAPVHDWLFPPALPLAALLLVVALVR